MIVGQPQRLPRLPRLTRLTSLPRLTNIIKNRYASQKAQKLGKRDMSLLWG